MPHPKEGPAEFVIVYDSKEDLRIRKSWSRKNPIQFHVDQVKDIKDVLAS